MKSTLSKFCCGLLSMIMVLSLCMENNLLAEDALESDGVVRTINFSSEESLPDEAIEEIEQTGTSYTGHSLRNVPNYIETKVEDVFQGASTQASPRTRKRLHYAHGPKWDAYTAWDVKVGNERSMGLGQVVVPLWQNGSSMLFADVRGQFDNNGAYEGNWGLGFRNIRDNSWILGVYGFYDRRKTSADNYFSQATFGIEALTVEWEARANVYLPEESQKTVSGSERAPRVLIFGNRVVIRSGGASQEKALFGVDAEVGKLIYEWGMGETELRGFVSAFHFDSNTDGFPNVSGGRSRLELRTYDLSFLGEGSRLNLGGEIQWDEVRGTQTTAMLRIQIPLGRKQKNHTRLQRRMLDRIVRDVDVVSTQSQGGSTDEEAMDVLTGRSFGFVDVVSNATANIPQVVLDNAAAGGGGPSTVFLSDSQGIINTTATLSLSRFQNIIGSGYNQAVVGATTGTALVFNVPGSIPSISSPGVNTITLADDTTVRGIGFIASSDGSLDSGAVFGDTVSRVAIDQNIFFGPAVSGSGLRVLTSFSGNVTNNVADGTGGDGLWIDSYIAGGVFNGVAAGLWANNLAINNASDGIHTGNVNAGTAVFNNESNNNGLFGYFSTLAGGIAFGNIGSGNASGGNTFP